jgi:O-acetyl-ADP-ribose deacetylase (regulator of RNase III)
VISYHQGDLLEADVQALVNAVNTVGVMGKGLALAFKQRLPANFQAYAAACQRGEVQTGRMFITETPALLGPRWIVNFPTKQHWRDPSQLAWVQSGLQELRRFLLAQQVASVALPALGAGLGGLSWPTVRAEIEAALADLAVDIRVYEPLAAGLR